MAHPLQRLFLLLSLLLVPLFADYLPLFNITPERILDDLCEMLEGGVVLALLEDLLPHPHDVCVGRLPRRLSVLKDLFAGVPDLGGPRGCHGGGHRVVVAQHLRRLLVVRGGHHRGHIL